MAGNIPIIGSTQSERHNEAVQQNGVMMPACVEEPCREICGHEVESSEYVTRAPWKVHPTRIMAANVGRVRKRRD